jgi:hypothetical protein
VLLCQLFLGLPLFLEPCGFHIRAALQGSWLSFHNVWPIHLNLHCLISILMFSWLVSFQSFSLEATKFYRCISGTNLFHIPQVSFNMP